MRAAGLMFRITPFMAPTRWSLVPKSVVRVMMGSDKESLRESDLANYSDNFAVICPFCTLSEVKDCVKKPCPSRYGVQDLCSPESEHVSGL